MFKLKITPDHHNAGPKLIYCLLPEPAHFSLPSTFKDASDAMHNWIRSAHTVKECNGKGVNVHKSKTNGSFSGGSGGWMTI